MGDIDICLAEEREGGAEAGASELEAMLERLEVLRITWADYAYGIELTYGDKSPGAKAMRKCIGDLYDCMRSNAALSGWPGKDETEVKK